MKRRIPKPYWEKSIAEKIAALANLRHPHNRYNPACQKAAQGHQDTLRELGVDPFSTEPSRTA
jgi:hypothetical protein